MNIIKTKKMKSHSHFRLLSYISCAFTLSFILVLFNQHVYKPTIEKVMTYMDNDYIESIIQTGVNKLRALSEGEAAEEVNPDTDEEKIKEVCKDAGDELFAKYYPNEVEGGKENDGNDTSIEQQAPSKTTENLVKLVDKEIDTMAFLKSYLMSILVWPVFIVFAILSIFFWCGCCCCCCCPCCCCRQSEKDKKANCCRYVSLIITIVFLGVVVALSVYGFFGTLSMVDGMNGALCGAFQLYWELMNGQHNKEVENYWKGFDGITLELQKIVDRINQIQDNRVSIFANKTELNDTFTEFDSEAHSNDPTEFQSTYTIGDKHYLYDYSSLYLDENNDSKLVPGMKEELQEYVDSGNDLLTQAEESSQPIEDFGNDIETSIGDITGTINDLSGSVESAVGNNIQKIIDIRSMIVQYLKLGLFAFFGMFAGFAVIILLLTLIFVLCKCRCLKCVVHCFWNILNLIIIFSFIIGAIIGLVGTLGKDATDFMLYLISEKNLNSTTPALLTGEIPVYLNTCFYGNGDISSKFMNFSIDDNIIGDLEGIQNDLYNTIYAIPNTSGVFNQSVKEFLDEGLVDLTKFLASPDGTNNNDQIEVMLTYLNDNCDQRIFVNEKDFEESTSENKLLVTDLKGKGNVKWDDLVNECEQTTNGDFRTKAGHLKELAEAINQDLNEEGGKMHTHNKDLINEFQGVGNVIKQKLRNLDEQVIVELMELIEDVSPSDKTKPSLMSKLVNCNFLGHNIYIFIDELHKGIGKGFYNFGVILETICMCQGFGVFFLLIVLNRYNPRFKKGKRKSPDEIPKEDDDDKEKRDENRTDAPLGSEPVKVNVQKSEK